ncbi:unnamed protein product [Phytomonas sp. Hart1]|nr:unnamed protein product [Phytomonas sp. Hart1]|eukprot:CCW69004.1 unnamed protein product [Phytomonas sp. isolate Hart1]
MSVVNEDDLVGYYMHVTLVNGTKVSGTVFTYLPKEGILVLLQNIKDQTSMKMVRIPFIHEYTIKSNVPKEHDLPNQLGPFAQLPSMHAGRDKSIFKHASSQLKQAEGLRMKHMGCMDPSTPIAACDAFSRVVRVYPDVSWDNEEKIIRLTNEVVIVGEPNWMTPKPILVDGAPEKEKLLTDRIQKLFNGVRKQ